jgi:hypothetical protein
LPVVCGLGRGGSGLPVWQPTEVCDVNAAMTAIRRLVRDADRSLPMMDVKPMVQLIDEALEQERLLA